MKNTIRTLGIIALVAVIGFSFAACGDGGGNTGGGDDVSGMATLNLSGQVYLGDWNDTNITYSPFTGNLTIANTYGGSGRITNGKLSYSIGTPTDLYTLDLEHEFDRGYDNFTSSRPTVRGVCLDVLHITGSDLYGGVGKASFAISVRNNSFSETDEEVRYYYVEEDLLVSGTGSTHGPETYREVGGGTYTYTDITRNMNLVLKAGWNAVYWKTETVGTFTGTWENSTSTTSTITVSLGNPALIWLPTNPETPPPPEPPPQRN